MEVLPLLREGKGVGEIQLEREGLYLRFSLRGLLPEGIWCVWICCLNINCCRKSCFSKKSFDILFRIFNTCGKL